MVPTQISCLFFFFFFPKGFFFFFFFFFFPTGFFYSVFFFFFRSLVSGCSVPLSLSSSSVLVFFTCTFFVQSSGHPSLTAKMCLHMGFLFLVQSSGHPSLTGMCLHMGCLVQSSGYKSTSDVSWMPFIDSLRYSLSILFYTIAQVILGF